METQEQDLVVTLKYDRMTHRYAKVSLPHPLSVCLRITDVCNRTCYHCCSGPSGNIGKTRDLKRLMTTIRKAGTPRLNITGGEPFTHPDIEGLLEYAVELGFGVSVTTSGDRVTERHVIFMGTRQIKPDVSLDGPDDKINRALRGNGSFDRVMEVASQCREHSVPFILNCTIQQHNLLHVDALATLGKQLLAKKITFIVIRPQGRAKSLPEILLSDDDIRVLHEKVELHRKTWTIGVMDLRKQPRSFVVVEPNGDIIAQSHDEYVTVGNALRDGTEFREVWADPEKFDHKSHLLHFVT